MKKNFLFATILLGTTFCYVSCSKNQITAAPATTTAPSATTTTAAKNSNPATMHYVGAPYYDCFVPAVSCLPTVTVRAPKLGDLLIAINSSTTATFFQSQEGISLSSDLGCDAGDLAKLQNGTYKVVYANSGSVQGRVHLFFGPSQTVNVNQPNTADYIIPTSQQ